MRKTGEGQNSCNYFTEVQRLLIKIFILRLYQDKFFKVEIENSRLNCISIIKVVRKTSEGES